MNSAEKIEMGMKFHAALLSRDWPVIRSLLADNATWTLPGNNLISGIAVGADEVAARAQKIAEFGGSFTLNHILVSRDNFARSIHNVAKRNGRALNEHLATSTVGPCFFASRSRKTKFVGKWNESASCPQFDARHSAVRPTSSAPPSSRVHELVRLRKSEP